VVHRRLWASCEAHWLVLLPDWTTAWARQRRGDHCRPPPQPPPSPALTSNTRPVRHGETTLITSEPLASVAHLLPACSVGRGSASVNRPVPGCLIAPCPRRPLVDQALGHTTRRRTRLHAAHTGHSSDHGTHTRSRVLNCPSPLNRMRWTLHAE
jgi:hypothetical protein